MIFDFSGENLEMMKRSWVDIFGLRFFESDFGKVVRRHESDVIRLTSTLRGFDGSCSNGGTTRLDTSII
jgi:hypothetical protein